MNLLQEYEQKQIARLTADKTIPAFKAGDSLRVTSKTKEGNLEKFEGLCIRVRYKGRQNVNSNFTVRKVSRDNAIEKTWNIFSPRILSIEVLKRGKVRRAKLYYIRELKGRAARIKEIIDHSKKPKK